MTPFDPPTLARWLRAACFLEATARKPGNVHPGASFVDLDYQDFVLAADAVAQPLSHAAEWGVGRAILAAVAATRDASPRNSNLGIILLLAPLAAVPADQPLDMGVREILNRLTIQDAALAYRAIRLAQPGGLGNVEDQDVTAEPTVTLLEAMQLAADRDTIAAQYTNGFELIFRFALPLLNAHDWSADWEQTVIRLYLSLLAQTPDSLIARKGGRPLAEEAAQRSQTVLAAGWPASPAGQQELISFDTWLRADGHRRNPGTTADLIAAALFAAFRTGQLECPAWATSP